MKTFQQLMCVLTLTSLVGCTQMKQAVSKQIDADPKIRKAATDSAMKSCVDGVDKKVPTRTAVQDQKINAYCGCFATKGIGQFSNTELEGIGFKGIESMTPAQNAKLQAAIMECKNETMGTK